MKTLPSRDAFGDVGFGIGVDVIAMSGRTSPAPTELKLDLFAVASTLMLDVEHGVLRHVQSLACNLDCKRAP